MFNFLTAGFLLLHTKNEKSLAEMVQKIILPRHLFKPFYFLAVISNMMTLVELNQAISGITSVDMGEGFWLSLFFISFAISNVVMVMFKLLLLPMNKHKVKTPLDSVFTETEP